MTLSELLDSTNQGADTWLNQRVLVIGGGGKAPPADSSALSGAVKAKLSTPDGRKQVLKDMIDKPAVKGYDVQMMQLADEDKSIEWVEEVRAVLKNGPWDAFIIGNGIRGMPSLTLCFEKLIAAGRELAPDVPMGFNTHPMDVLAAIDGVWCQQ